jgi:hypothetical protein
MNELSDEEVFGAQTPQAQRAAPGELSDADVFGETPAAPANPVGLGERLFLNAREGFQNTLAGETVNRVQSGQVAQGAAMQANRAIQEARAAGSPVGLPSFAGQTGQDAPSPYDSVPMSDLEKMMHDAAASSISQHLDYEAARKQQHDEEAAAGSFMDQPTLGGKLAHGAAALVGQLAGGIASPENVIAPESGVARATGEGALKYLGRRFADAAVHNAPVVAAADTAVQGSQVDRGAREEFDPIQLVLSTAMGGSIAGGLHVAPEALRMGWGAIREKLGRARGVDPSTITPDSVSPEEAQLLSGDADLRAALEANGIASPADPRAAVLKGKLEERRAAEAENAARPINTDRVQVREEKDAIEAGDLDPAAASAVNARRAAVPDVIVPEKTGEAGVVAGAELRGKFHAPVPVEPQPSRMTPDEISAARRRAEAGKGPGEAGDTLTAPEDRLPQTRDDIVNERQAADAFAVAGQRRERYEGAVTQEGRTDVPQPRADVQAAGRPEGANRQEVTLVGDQPVKITGATTDGRLVVEPYDPRTGEIDPNGRPFVVKAKDTRTVDYAPDERLAQDFTDRAQAPRRGVGLENPGPRGATDRIASRQAAGLRGDVIPPAPKEAPRGAPRGEGPIIDGEVVGRAERPASAAPEGAPAIRDDRFKGQAPEAPRSLPAPEARAPEPARAASPAEPAPPFRLEPEGEPPARPAGPKETTPYAREPKRPETLLAWIKRNGGVKDVGGDVTHTLGGAKGRPGVINNREGMSLDDAAQKAWEDGYIGHRGGDRPTINDFLDAIADDARGEHRFSADDEAAVTEYHDARATNAEIDRISSELDIPTDGKSRAEFWDAAAERMSEDDAARHADEMARSAEQDFAEAAARAREAMGGDFNPADVYHRGEPASLEDLERAYQQEQAASHGGHGEERLGEREPAAPGAGDVQAGDGQGARGARSERRAGAEGDQARDVQAGPEAGDRAAIDITDQGEQRVIPGAERATPEEMRRREIARRQEEEKLRAKKPQKTAGEDGGLFDSGHKQRDMFGAEKPADPKKAGPEIGDLTSRLNSGIPLDVLWNDAKKIFGKTLGFMGEEWTQWSNGVTALIRHLGKSERAGSAREALTDFARSIAYSNDGFFQGLMHRYRDNDAARGTISEIRNLFFAEGGDRGRAAVGETYEAAIRDNANHYLNRLSKVLDPFKKMATDDAERLYKQLGELLVRGKDGVPGTPVSAAVKEIRAILKELHGYQQEAGVELGKVKNYLPRVENTEQILRNPAAFKKDVENYLVRHEGADRARAREAAEEWFSRVLTGDLGVTMNKTDFVRINAASGAPQHTKGRVLGDKADQVLERWLLRNPAEILPQYITRAVKRAEWTRRMGPELEHWQAFKQRLLDAGAGEAIPQIVRTIESASGMMGASVTGGIRKVAGARARSAPSPSSRGRPTPHWRSRGSPRCGRATSATRSAATRARSSNGCRSSARRGPAPRPRASSPRKWASSRRRWTT